VYPGRVCYPPPWGPSYRCFPVGRGYPTPAPIGHPVGNQLLKDNYDISRERDFYKSKLYRHEEASKGMVSVGAIGAIAGGLLGALGFFVNPILGVSLALGGALGGAALGGGIGNKLGDADAVTHDADDDQRKELNGSPLREVYQKPAFDPGYYYPSSGGYRRYYM
jgi:hypothetical protein